MKILPAQSSPRSPLLDRSRLKPAEVIGWVIAIAVYFVFPEDLGFATSVLVTALFVLSLDLILGYAGVISLGHAVFFGVGAYTAALIALHGWREPITGALVGAGAGGLAAFIIGALVLRLRDIYLIMVTLALGVIAFEAANKATWLTRGDDGLVGINLMPVFGVFEWSFYSTTSYLYALAWLFLSFALARRLVTSPFGLILQGIRENPQRMALVGAPVFSHLMRIYTISGCMAGLAGTLSAQTAGTVNLTSLSLDTSIAAVVMLVVGGVGRLYGALVGTAVYMIVQHSAAQWNPYHWLFIIGAMLVLVVMFAKGGLLGLADTLVHRLRAKIRAR